MTRRPPPSAETLGPRFVHDRLIAAEEALVAAHVATEDKFVADELAKARTHVRAAASRAGVVLKHVALGSAKQQGLFDPAQED